MAVYPPSNTVVTSPTCHLSAAQIPNTLSSKLSSTSKVDCLANTSAISANTNSLAHYNPFIPYRSDIDPESKPSSTSSPSSYPDSTNSPTFNSITEDVMDFAAHFRSIQVNQKLEGDMCLVEPMGRSKRVRKLTSKALELHQDTTSRYYISSNILGNSQKSQHFKVVPPVSNSCTSSAKPVAGSKRKRDAAAKGEIASPPVKRTKQDQEGLSQGRPTQDNQSLPELDMRNMKSIIPRNVGDDSHPSNSEAVKLKGEKRSSIKCQPIQEELTAQAGKGGEGRNTSPIRRRSTRSTDILVTNTAVPDESNKVENVALSINDPTAEVNTDSAMEPILNPKCPQKCLHQSTPQAPVPDNISFITIRLPSTQLRRFKVSSSPLPQEMKTRHSKSSSPNHGKDAKHLESTMKLEFGDPKCQLSCLKSADPSLLLYALGKAMAQMDGEGTEDESDEDFDPEHFQQCMKEQCICNEKQAPSKVISRIRLKIRPVSESACTAKHAVSVSKSGKLSL